MSGQCELATRTRLTLTYPDSMVGSFFEESHGIGVAHRSAVWHLPTC